MSLLVLHTGVARPSSSSAQRLTAHRRRRPAHSKPPSAHARHSRSPTRHKTAAVPAARQAASSRRAPRRPPALRRQGPRAPRRAPLRGAKVGRAPTAPPEAAPGQAQSEAAPGSRTSGLPRPRRVRSRPALPPSGAAACPQALASGFTRALRWAQGLAAPGSPAATASAQSNGGEAVPRSGTRPPADSCSRTTALWVEREAPPRRAFAHTGGISGNRGRGAPVLGRPQ